MIGLRASGKTTVGRALADRLQLPFYDSDERVTARTGRTPAQWLASDGEAAFREVEQAAITELAQRPDGVLAAGGGAPTVAENRAALAGWSTVLLLAPLDVLVDRLAGDSTRPALTDRSLPDEIAFLGMARQDHYLAMGPVVVAETDRPLADVVEEIAEAVSAQR